MADSPAESQLSPQQSPLQQVQNSTSTSLANLQTIAQARAELETRLAGIHNDLQLTQTIGLLFVKRQDDLKNAFEQLEQLSESEDQLQDSTDAGSATQPLPDELREQLLALDREFQEGQNGIVGLKQIIDAQLTSRSGTALAASALPSSTLPTQTISKPRRHKVVMPSGPSVNDAAFPLQIQEELLNQVRYWTSQAEMKEKLNQEYDTKINEQERIIDALNKQRRLREESEERQKEDQWNLELQNQELRNQNEELRAQLSKAGHENTKIQKAFATATEQLEQVKDKEERTASQLEVVKTKFEQDMSALRKHAADVQREKVDLITKVEELNTTVSLQQQKLSKKATLDAIALAQELEEKEKESTAAAPILIQSAGRTFSGDNAAATSAAAALAAEPKIASLARETSFAHQQSIISDLQTKLTKEITEKEELLTAKEELLVEKDELVKMLADREETIETMRLEGVVAFEPNSLSKRSSTALLGNTGTRHQSDMGLSEDSDALDHHDLSITMSENDSRDFSNGRVSPFPAGGLFAELAQATSHSNLKGLTEYKDQEAMTEPIESWIHTIPGISALLNGHAAPQENSVAESAVDGSIIKGKPGTETRRIPTLDAATSSPDEEGVSVAVAGSLQDRTHQANEISDDASGDVGVVHTVSRIKSETVTDDGRRHTCDLSQTMTESSSSTIPQVPEIPKELSTGRTTLDVDDEKEFRVSFGSAFGGDPGATDTGRIRSVYANALTDDQRAAVSQSITEESENHSAAVPAVIAGVTAAKATGAVASAVASKDVEKTVDFSANGNTSPIATNGQHSRSAIDTAAGQKDIKQQTASSSESVPEKNIQDLAVSSESQSAVRPATAVVSVSSRTTYTYNQEPNLPTQPNANSSIHHYHVITDSSGASIGRQPNYRGSPNGSISTMSTDYHGGQYRRRMSTGSNYDVTATDPTMIQLITQTMIGDHLWKYTRKRMANMMNEKSHRRFVWVHPYTKTLYWSLSNPGAEGSREQRAKSAFIVAVFQVADEPPSSQNSELPNVHILVQTTTRNLKLRAPTREKHELWFQSISYLLSRPTTPGADTSTDNQTWSEVQANNQSRGLTAAGPSSNDVINLRQSDKANNALRKKGSANRLQSMFGRNSLSKDGPVGSSRIGPSGLASSTSHPGVTTTATATAGPGVAAGNGLEHSGSTN
ncbi:hypothetical protein BGZ98_007832 [Dissophora globulifera]|nr:hypothetical protein BGZ98_007832 [Dissophora globulifera]